MLTIIHCIQSTILCEEVARKQAFPTNHCQRFSNSFFCCFHFLPTAVTQLYSLYPPGSVATDCLQTHQSYGLTLGPIQRYKSYTPSRVFAVSDTSVTAPRTSPLCESGGTGRRARLRISWATVGVQVPPLAPPRYRRQEAPGRRVEGR